MNRPDVTAPNDRQEAAGMLALRDALAGMSELARREGDAVQGGKFSELAAKLDRGLLTVAFCGHFSAGKSTLVNALCGANLLPSSPIPTSANVVTIESGEPSARMTFRDKDGTITQERPVPFEELHAFAVDGEGVASIAVSYPVPLLGGVMAIVDTPGVDSTDSAHRSATESALHLADVVFYVTDYNHVLSDVNFRFLRTLADWGKPAYVIVNQIDKHRESEVPFAVFRDGIRQALETWKIRPAGVLFLSLRYPEHQLSQWDELTALLKRLQPLRSELMTRSAERSARYLAEQFRETVRDRHRPERERLMEVLGSGEDEEPGVKLGEWRSRLTDEHAALRSGGERRRESLRTELERLLGNANLTPAETREKASDVLESMQPGFKAGWFAGAAKTEAERERRLSVLAEDFNRQISAHLKSHVKDLLRRAAREAGWDGGPMEASLDSLWEPVSLDWLRGRVKSGMGSDGQATLHYAAELSSDIKGVYRREALKWSDDLEDFRAEDREREEKRIASEWSLLADKEAAFQALAALESAEQEERDRLLSLLPSGSDSLPKWKLPEPKTADLTLLETDAEFEEPASQENKVAEGTVEGPDYPLGTPVGAVEWLLEGSRILKAVPALAKTAEQLAAKAARFRDRRFTIALFGAFSAGKSSFANALVGMPALPVSPNPTTATINRIVAPTAEHVNGSARVTMKSREAMLGDIRHSLKRLGIPKTDIEAAGDDARSLLGLADRTDAAVVHPRGKPHLAFLRAASEGWASYAGMLDTQLSAAGEEYRRYAADEQASCFVAEIDLAVDSPLTRGGAVLVDTPGADSINARHTGVAFEYIKNADAVLFVTYYNHAFTEADRHFLNQLGSVKDVFELDKMFFIINAADLAASGDELEAVKDHVAGQLLKHGIRNPRLFGVSSLNGLRAKRTGNRQELENSGLTAFELAFRTFAETELGGLAMASARKEMQRAGKQLDGWLQAASADAAAREAESQRLQREAESWREQGASNVPDAAVQPLQQETSDQLYHLRQRIYYRFGEHFLAAFHPSVLQDDGRDLRKLLQACWEDLKRSLGEDLLQELRSAGLRLEGTLGRALEDQLTAISSGLAADGFLMEPAVRPHLALPLDEPFAQGPELEIKRLWQAFKSPKHFFENEGAKGLRDQLSALLFGEVDAWLSELSDRWKAEVAGAYRNALKEAYAGLADELAAYSYNLGHEIRTEEEKHVWSEIGERWHSLQTIYESGKYPR